MFDFLTKRAENLEFMPHGQCFLWDPELIILHAVSDMLIFIAYFSIPVALLYFVWRRKDFPFPRLIVLFCLFIFACGATHLIGFWNIWNDHYWVAGFVKFITALISVLAGFVLIPLIPQALNMPSPKRLALLNQMLKHHAKDLEQANSELKSFAYIVSHDLKAPLRGIHKLSNWLVADYGDKLDQDGKDMIDLLSNRVHRMDNLIEGILQYSRAGKDAEYNREIDLNQLLGSVIDSLSPPEHVKIQVDGTLPTLSINETLITQVFQNLLSNAMKFIDKPQGLIQVNCVEKNTVWEFHITDNGVGIEPQYYEKIFQIFQTLSARDVQENTGIGLTIVKKIIGVLQGEIWVESTLGVGSTFIFTLPKQKA